MRELDHGLPLHKRSMAPLLSSRADDVDFFYIYFLCFVFVFVFFSPHFTCFFLNVSLPELHPSPSSSHLKSLFFFQRTSLFIFLNVSLPNLHFNPSSSHLILKGLTCPHQHLLPVVSVRPRPPRPRRRRRRRRLCSRLPMQMSHRPGEGCTQ